MNFEEIKEYLCYTESSAVHSKNFLAKLNNNFGSKNGFSNLEQLQLFFNEYKMFRENLLELTKNVEMNIKEIVSTLNNYKDFVNKINIFSSQSKFEPTILEEFIFYLLNNIFIDEKIRYGSVNAYCNLYFSPKNINDFLNNPSIRINSKYQDFSIFRRMQLNADHKEFIIDVPIISIECKTYLNKTMLEGSIATAEKVKMGNPHSKFYIVTETYEIDYNVDISYSRIDQIFVLRKQKRRTNPLNKIYSDVVLSLYRDVKQHLSENWIDVENNILNKGLIK